MSYVYIPHRISFCSKLHSHIKLLRNRKKVQNKLNQAWPEGRKDIQQVMQDMKDLIWKHNCKWRFIIGEYFGEGLHRCDHPLEEYVLLMEWNRLRDVYDYTLFPDLVQKIGNKIEFKTILQQHGYPVSALLGLLKNEGGKLILEKDGNKVPLADVLTKTGGVFVKPDNLLQGRGCAKIQPCNIPGKYLLNSELVSEADIAMRIFQVPDSDNTRTATQLNDALLTELLVENHESIGNFHPSSLNTLRLITMKTPCGGVELNRAILRFGAGGSTVDNLSAGGVSVPVDINTGKLVKYGHAKAIETPPYTKHPDSGITFEGFEIPYWKEAVELTMELRRKLFPEVFNIGFDVAITPHGPVMIEANVRSGFFLRASAGGLRPIMNCWLRPLVEELQAGRPTIH